MLYIITLFNIVSNKNPYYDGFVLNCRFKDILPIEEYDDTSFFANSDVIDIDNQELSKFIDSILPDMYIKKEKNDYYDSQPQTFYYPLKQSKDDDNTQIY